MRKLIIFNMMTLDGSFEGANRELDWHIVDSEFQEFAIHQLNAADTLLFGRITYQLMAGYWPTAAAIQNEPLIAEAMNTKSKFVFSRTLSDVGWVNAKLISQNAIEEIAKLKQQTGKDILLLGSADLASDLIKHGLIDEYRVMVSPLVLGNGRPLFKDVNTRLKLKTIKTKQFASGNVLLCYEPL